MTYHKGLKSEKDTNKCANCICEINVIIYKHANDCSDCKNSLRVAKNEKKN